MNFLLLSAAVCAKKVDQIPATGFPESEPVDLPTTKEVDFPETKEVDLPETATTDFPT